MSEIGETDDAPAVLGRNRFSSATVSGRGRLGALHSCGRTVGEGRLLSDVDDVVNTDCDVVVPSGRSTVRASQLVPSTGLVTMPFETMHD